MSFTVIKTLTTNSKKQPLIVRLLILLIVIPLILVFVLLIAAIMLIVTLVSRITRLFTGKKAAEQPAQEVYQEAIIVNSLFNDGQFSVEIEEDGNDNDHKMIFDLWQKLVDELDYASFGRAITKPEVPGLTGEFISSFIREGQTGLLVQIIDKEKAKRQRTIDTSLYFCKYADLSLTMVAHVGPYLLHADQEDPDLIHGFNNAGNIELTIKEESN